MKVSEINKFLNENIEKLDCLRIIFNDNSFRIGTLLHNKTKHNQWFFVSDIDLEDYCQNEGNKYTKIINGEDIGLLIIEPIELRQKSESFIVLKYLKQQLHKVMEDLND
jgi:hypothetical protein